MSNRCHGIVYHHAGTCPAHNSANLLTHFGFIAVYGTALAGRLLVTKLANIEPLMGISY